MTHKTFLCSTLALGAAFICGALTPAHAEEETYTITIKDHRFEPSEVKVPAGQPIKITVENHDGTPEEFESHDLRIEKVIPGGGTATVRVAPLKAGEYEFVGEFHEDSAHGKLIAE